MMVPESKKSRHAGWPRMNLPLVIFVIAIVVRAVFLLAMLFFHEGSSPEVMFPDTTKYIDAADFLFGRNETGEYQLLLVGPGYPVFLGLLMTIFGQSYSIVLMIQIVLSAATAACLAAVARLLYNNRLLAFLTGLIAALSLTSISLAAALLSDTLLLFLFVFSVYLCFRGIQEDRRTLLTVAGLLGGLSILVRSVALFLPPLVIIFAFLAPASWRSPSRRTFINSVLVAAIMILIPLVWAGRNVARHDIFTVAETGPGAARLFLAGKVLHTARERPPHEYRAFRDSLYAATVPNIESGRYKKLHDETRAFIFSTIQKYPGLFLRTYLATVLGNATAISALHNIQLPHLANLFDRFDRNFNPGHKNPLILLLTLIGSVLLIRKNARPTLMLLGIIICFAAASGVTFGQGSRIYFPAQTAWPIMVAASFIFFYDLGGLILRSLTILAKRPAR